MRRIAVLISAGVVLLLVLAQLLLPSVAAQLLRDRLSRSGKVLDVQVDAFPAIELLWHHADRVVVRMARYSSGTGSLDSMLGQVSGVGSLDVSMSEFRDGLVTLHDATLSKSGSRLIASARVSEADLRAAIPFLEGVRPVASGANGLTLRGTTTLLGLTASVDANLVAQGGRLIVQPDVPFGSLAAVTVFGDPHVEVQGVSASPVRDGFSVLARAQLR
jgi:hypothetical protein